eukprot:SAG11_NODE_21675_length_420_cov_1.501558_1_plen_37_part_01
MFSLKFSYRTVLNAGLSFGTGTRVLNLVLYTLLATFP